MTNLIAELIESLTKMGFKVEKDNIHDTYTAEITDVSGYNTLSIYFGNDIENKITARVDKINGTHKWYYSRTAKQILAVVRQCMEGYTFPEPTKADKIEAMDNDAEDPSVSLDEFIAKVEQIEKEEETMTRTEAIEAINTRQNEANLFTNVSEADIEAEMKKEENTMKATTKIDLKSGVITFEYENSTYTHANDTNYYYRTCDGKKTRISKADWQKAHDAHITAEQDALDAEPCMTEVNTDLSKPAVFRKDNPDCVDCSNCNVQGCVHRDCMRRNPRSAGGCGECPRLDVKPEEPEIPTEAEQVAEQEGIEISDAELLINIRKEEEQKTPAKKPSRPRRSKDVAFEKQFGAETLTLTAKQVDFLLHLSQTGIYDINHEMIIEDIVIAIDGQFADKPMTIGAMISTLCEKGLADRIKTKLDKRTVTAFQFTPSGKDVVRELGLA